jgi:hypothetical protein
MQVQQQKRSFTFSKPARCAAVRTLNTLLEDPRLELEHVPLRVVGWLGLKGGDIWLEYRVEAFWSRCGKPGWHRITVRSPEAGQAARRLFAESEAEACVIDEAIEHLLGLLPSESSATRVLRDAHESLAGAP